MTTLAQDIVTTLGPVFSGRLYPLVAPEKVTWPYGCYQQISGGELYTLEGPSGVFYATMQIDVFSKLKSEADQLALASEAAMAGATLFDTTGSSKNESFEDPPVAFHVMVEFSVLKYA